MFYNALSYHEKRPKQLDVILKQYANDHNLVGITYSSSDVCNLLLTESAVKYLCAWAKRTHKLSVCYSQVGHKDCYAGVLAAGVEIVEDENLTAFLLKYEEK